MAIKYFKIRNLETVLAVDDTKIVGQGKNTAKLIEQYEKRPDYYIPCDAKGNPLKAEKAAEKEAEPKAEAKAEVKEEPKAEAKADKKAEKAEKE